jgi:glycosyltransferase involved in cell wall biosynthesis
VNPSKRLIYFSDDIDSSFVYTDILELSKRFESIILFVTNPIKRLPKLPDNVIVQQNYINWKSYRYQKIILQNFISIAVLYFIECFKCRKILNLRASIALLVSNRFKADSIKQILKTSSYNPDNAVFYSFWFYDCVFLAWLKRDKFALEIYARAHGGDLFEERGSLAGKVLFRNFQFKHCDKIFSVSQKGTEYLKTKYPQYANKFFTAYLGSKTHSEISPFSNSEFVIVSCASIRNIKRIHVLAELMAGFKSPITWYHIGNENLNVNLDPTIQTYKKYKKSISENSNVKFIPLGLMSNEAVYDFYKKTPVNAFISISEAEGVPVSMMEAISFGIPIISTDVGGCSEIVTSETGKLIPLSSSISDLENLLLKFKTSKMNTEEFRKGIKKYWQQNFNLENNYKDFFANLIS